MIKNRICKQGAAAVAAMILLLSAANGFWSLGVFAETTAVPVTSAAELAKALTPAMPSPSVSGNLVTLNSNVTLKEDTYINITGGAMTLELNQYNVTGTIGISGGSLTLQSTRGGTVSYMMVSSGGTLDIKAGTVSNVSVGGGSFVVSGGTASISGYVQGNGNLEIKSGSLTVSGGSFGNITKSGGTLRLEGGAFQGYNGLDKTFIGSLMGTGKMAYDAASDLPLQDTNVTSYGAFVVKNSSGYTAPGTGTSGTPAEPILDDNKTQTLIAGVSNVTASSASFNGTFVFSEKRSGRAYFQYRSANGDQGFRTAYPEASFVNRDNGSVKGTAEQLSPNTEYLFRLVTDTEAGWDYSDTYSFRTLKGESTSSSSGTEVLLSGLSKNEEAFWSKVRTQILSAKEDGTTQIQVDAKDYSSMANYVLWALKDRDVWLTVFPKKGVAFHIHGTNMAEISSGETTSLTTLAYVYQYMELPWKITHPNEYKAALSKSVKNTAGDGGVAGGGNTAAASEVQEQGLTGGGNMGQEVANITPRQMPVTNNSFPENNPPAAAFAPAAPEGETISQAQTVEALAPTTADSQAGLPLWVYGVGAAAAILLIGAGILIILRQMGKL